MNSQLTPADSTRHHGRNAFLLASLASPLYLLTPSLLASSSFDKKDALMTAKALGNNFPPVLLGALQGAWRTIFKIATGEQGPLQAIRTWMQGIDWQELRNCKEREWYQTGDYLYADSIVPSCSDVDFRFYQSYPHWFRGL